MSCLKSGSEIYIHSRWFQVFSFPFSCFSLYPLRAERIQFLDGDWSIAGTNKYLLHEFSSKNLTAQLGAFLVLSCESVWLYVQKCLPSSPSPPHSPGHQLLKMSIYVCWRLVHKNERTKWQALFHPRILWVCWKISVANPLTSLLHKCLLVASCGWGTGDRAMTKANQVLAFI